METVNEKCDVLKEHCLESNGGLYFNNYQDFVECMRLLIENDRFREKLGENGYSYARENFMWSIIIKKLDGVDRPSWNPMPSEAACITEAVAFATPPTMPSASPAFTIMHEKASGFFTSFLAMPSLTPRDSA